jgi:hypothetical protein
MHITRSLPKGALWVDYAPKLRALRSREACLLLIFQNYFGELNGADVD